LTDSQIVSVSASVVPEL